MGGGFHHSNRNSPGASRYGGGGSGNSTLGGSSDGGNSKPRVFISFHVEDENQVELLRQQAKDPRFKLEFTDYSVKEPFDEKWKTQCTERIKQSSVVVVAIGKDTHQREAVLWEIQKAYELGKPVIGMRIYKDANHTIPKLMRDHNARIVPWKVEELQKELDKNKKTDN